MLVHICVSLFICLFLIFIFCLPLFFLFAHSVVVDEVMLRFVVSCLSAPTAQAWNVLILYMVVTNIHLETFDKVQGEAEILNEFYVLFAGGLQRETFSSHLQLLLKRLSAGVFPFLSRYFTAEGMSVCIAMLLFTLS